MDTFRDVALKIDRAKKHFAELEGELRRYFAFQPYKVGVRIGAEKRPNYFVESVVEVPDAVTLAAGDTIQNLVSSLDHLAFRLVCAATAGRPPNPRGVYFPIADDSEQYERKKRTRLAGASAAAIGAVDALRPYRGGDDVLWELHALNNVEKHRLLLAVGAQAAGIHLGQLMAPHVAGVFPPEAVAMFESMNHFLMPANPGYPLRAGWGLYTGAPGEEPNPKLKFRFAVVFNEQGIVAGRPVLEVISLFIKRVEEVTNALRPYVS